MDPAGAAYLWGAVLGASIGTTGPAVVLEAFISDNNPVNWISVDRLQRCFGQERIWFVYRFESRSITLSLVPEAHAINQIITRRF